MCDTKPLKNSNNEAESHQVTKYNRPHIMGRHSANDADERLTVCHSAQLVKQSATSARKKAIMQKSADERQ